MTQMMDMRIDLRFVTTMNQSKYKKLKNNNTKLQVLDPSKERTKMMDMFGQVNIDRNCVGWYHTMRLGKTIYTISSFKCFILYPCSFS
jgi:hypothetical protein